MAAEGAPLLEVMYACAGGLALTSVCLGKMMIDAASDDGMRTAGAFHRNWPAFCHDMLSGHGMRSPYVCAILRGSDADANFFMLRMWQAVKSCKVPWYVMLESEVSRSALKALRRRGTGGAGEVLLAAFKDERMVAIEEYADASAFHSRDMLRFAVVNGVV